MTGSGRLGFARWTRRFEDERERRNALGDPDWERGAALHPAVWSGIQRFQVGEDGDGANLVAKADRAADPDYARAVRLFVAEEQNHARLLARLLAAGGLPTLTGHWSDTVFVRLRRLMGLRLELLVLMIAEVVALRYYRALRDGTGDPLTSDVAGRILADEQRHVPFHCERLHASLAELPRPARRPVMASWRLLLLAVSLVVAADHGPGLRRLGLGRRRFVADVMASSGEVVSAVLPPVSRNPEPNRNSNAPSNAEPGSTRHSPHGGTRR
ncbi:ferritin-like domain-containing protein [Streptomyces phaeoluteigriseus]|uniref:Ferritin-like domain-containing protein n=1 Tax=Streptomyces phaeoluteigriseus TaxID=114686 RepID=A0ABY4Z074_9ACTN|nr:ferritin-like domain-containing protein [Streptomyces phaeoluteigriseus]USQ82448.1 ferritin-like domain-containing protein [Streptomyces phaeoluteigriseus]